MLAVDLDVLERNLARMAASARARGIALRPHAKTHKCVEIARRQRDLGAVGLSVATVGEAEVFAAAGHDDLFIAYPVWASPERAVRLRALAERVALRVGVDSTAGAEALGRAVPGLEVLVEVDSGHARSGVLPGSAADVASTAERAGLRVRGVFTFPGHGNAPGAGPSAAAGEADALAGSADRLLQAGYDAAVRSGGSTPTAAHSTGPAVTELRPGVYAFNDAQQVRLGSCELRDVALVALATVVSAPAAGRVVLDAGSKVLGADRPPWADGHGLLPDHPGAVVSSLSEHHAVVTGADGLAVGELVRVVPNHVCTAVNLVDALLVLRGGEVVDSWAVAARGANT